MLKICCFIFLSLLSFAKTCSGEKSEIIIEDKPRPEWLKTEFDHVVWIEDEDVSKINSQYEIKIEEKLNPDSVAVFFLSAHVPLDYFKNSKDFYPNQKAFILIIPDWEFYQKVAEDATKNGIMLEPATTNYYYYFLRENNQLKIDEYHISGDGHPIIKH